MTAYKTWKSKVIHLTGQYLIKNTLLTHETPFHTKLLPVQTKTFVVAKYWTCKIIARVLRFKKYI